MKNVLAFLIGLVLAIVIAPAPAQQKVEAETVVLVEDTYSPEAFRRDVANATVIFRDGKEEKGYLGTGVVILQDKDKALIVTAAHVVEDEDMELAFVEQIRPGKEPLASKPGLIIKKYDRILDLAILETEPVFAGSARMYTNEGIKTLQLYARCYSLGFPRVGSNKPIAFPHMTGGFISSFDGPLQFSAQVYYGNSGGGIFVQDGNRFVLVGIVQRIFPKDSSHMYDYIGHASNPTVLIDFVK